MPPPVNLSNVNISIQQFQEISSGTHNAGEVRLSDNNSLEKINNFVSRTGKNKVSLGQAEVLAIKDAFLKALEGNGVGKDEICRIRQELGLAPRGVPDADLTQRSIKPLSRQKIREILDKNAETINNSTGKKTITTYDELHAGFTDKQRSDIAKTRRETNAALVHSRQTIKDRSIVDIQTVISGYVHFRGDADRLRLIVAAERIKSRILDRAQNGVPSNEPDATIKFTHDADGFDLNLYLGGSDAETLKKVDSLLLLLRSHIQPGRDTFEVRNEFGRLTTRQARMEWVGKLAADPAGAFKARTVLMGILMERGINDWATLSKINSITDAGAIEILTGILQEAKVPTGDALRQSAHVAKLSQRGSAEPIPPNSKAFVPVRSSDEYVAAMREGINGNDQMLTREMKMLREAVVAELKQRFGADIVNSKLRFEHIVSSKVFNEALGNVENGIPGKTIEQMKAVIVEGASHELARRALTNALKPIVEAAGAKASDAISVASSLLVRHPELGGKLAAVKSPEDIQSTLADYRTQMQDAARRKVLIDKCRAASAGWYRAALAEALRVPVSSLTGNFGNVSRLNTMNGALAHNIGEGKNPADTEEQIEKAFREVVDKFVSERVEVLRKLDGLQVPPEARDIMKGTILSADKLKGIDLKELQKVADKLNEAMPTAELVELLDLGDKDKILNKMGEIARRASDDTMKAIGGQAGMLEELDVAGKLVLTMALAKVPTVFDMMRSFFTRPDVVNIHPMNLTGTATFAGTFMFYKPEEPIADSNAALAGMLAKPDLPPLPAQAIVQALEDLGLGDLSGEEKAQLLQGADGRALASKVRKSPQAITPSRLRALATAQFADYAAFRVASKHIEALAKENGIAGADKFLGFSVEVLFGSAPAVDNVPSLRSRMAEAIRMAASQGGDPAAAVRDMLAAFDEKVIVSLRSFEAIQSVNDTATEQIIQGVAERANLDIADVRKHLNLDGILLEGGGSLHFLRAEIRESLATQGTDLAKWDVGAIRKRAADMVEAFVNKKVAFLAEVDNMPLTDAGRGALIIETLEQRSYTDRDFPAAATVILARPEIRQVFDFAKAVLAPGKAEKMTDDELFRVLEDVSTRINAAIEDVLPKEKRLKMDNDDHIVMRDIVAAAFVDYCGETLISAAAKLAAAGRLEKIDDVGGSVHSRYNIEYLNHSSGYDEKGKKAPVNMEAATAANKKAAAAALGRRLFTHISNALDDEWLPADLAQALHLGTADDEQAAIAKATVTRAPGLFERFSANLDAGQRAELKAFLITLDLRDDALEASMESINAKLAGFTFVGAFDAPGSLSAERALALGYVPAELQMLEHVADLYAKATGCTLPEARAMAVDNASPARRLYSYGGRFTSSAENFRAGLALLNTFKGWFSATTEAVKQRHANGGRLPDGAPLTVLNAESTYFRADAEYAYEKFFFEHLAIDESMPLATDDPEKLFGMANNPVTRFVGRAYVASALNTFAQIPPEKRPIVFAVFDLLAPLPKTQEELKFNNSGNFNCELIGRVLAHLEEIEGMIKDGTLTKESFCSKFLKDVPGAAGMTLSEIGNAYSERLYRNVLPNQLGNNMDKLTSLTFMVISSGATADEAVEAIIEGRKLPAAPYVSEVAVGITELNLTAAAGRTQLVTDLKRPSNPAYIKDNKPVLKKEQSVFTVNFPDGTSLKSSTPEDADAVADKIADICGKVHPAQLNSVFFALTQSCEGPVVGAFEKFGIRAMEHMPLTYTLSRDAHTGVVTVHYSEPAGFPKRFHWDMTVALDGTTVASPMIIEE